MNVAACSCYVKPLRRFHRLLPGISAAVVVCTLTQPARGFQSGDGPPAEAHFRPIRL